MYSRNHKVSVILADQFTLDFLHFSIVRSVALVAIVNSHRGTLINMNKQDSDPPFTIFCRRLNQFKSEAGNP